MRQKDASIMKMTKGFKGQHTARAQKADRAAHAGDSDQRWALANSAFNPFDLGNKAKKRRLGRLIRQTNR